VIDEINSADDDELDEKLDQYGFNVEKYHTHYVRNGEEVLVFQREKARKDLIAKCANKTEGVSVSHYNDILKTIVGSINDYLLSNTAVNDFHLMKDIVDRNCDAKEEEITTQIPIPLYMGLVGTMAGILVGILYLWLSGGIADLLSTGGGSGADGVEALLGGVALAMISSILGIILTTWGSNAFKTAKSKVERHKHYFLSWIQAKLLPKLSDNIVSEIAKMAENLNRFNLEFADNTTNLGSALENVNESYKLQNTVITQQKELLSTLKKIRDRDVIENASRLLGKLTECSNVIGKLAEYLQDANSYLQKVQELDKKLDSYADRTRFIEHASSFYAKHENWLSENIETANRTIRDSIEKYNSAVSDTMLKMQEKLEDQRRKLLEFGENMQQQQQTMLSENAKEIGLIVGALKQQTEAMQQYSESMQQQAAQNKSVADTVNGIMHTLEKNTREQTRKIEDLTSAIHSLAKAKSEGSIRFWPFK